MAHDETQALEGASAAPTATSPARLPRPGSRSSRAKSRDAAPAGEVGPGTSTALDADGSGGERDGGAGQRTGRHAAPERTCILSGRKDARDALIRLALGPDGQVAPDVRARAPGRGAWIGVDRAELEQAIARGRLVKALARTFKAAVTVPADLADQIERALARLALDRLGLEARAGLLVTGSERIAQAARAGTVSLLLHAADAAADGSRRLDQALRVGLGAEGSDVAGLAIPASRAILSMALGRENVVHIALIAPAAAARVSHALGRWRGYMGWNDRLPAVREGSQG